ncbi:MAG: hypothetical protein DYG89_19840 [Caldilinea sp. CFX5]|nr:hypothetical protein [Caldilinea sp. CFX5]
MRWRHQTSAVETVLSAPVSVMVQTNMAWRNLDYTVSHDQQKLLIRYGHGLVDNADKGYGYDLLLYDLSQATLTTVLTTTDYIFSFAISPDHQWAAYIVRDVKPPSRYRWWQRWLKTHPCACGEPPMAGTVYLVHLQPPYQAQPVDVCGPSATGAGECSGLLGWSADEQRLLWLDGTGIWAVEPHRVEKRLLVKDVQAAGVAVTSESTPLSRYLLGRSYLHPIVHYGVLDRQSWWFLELPESAEHTFSAESLFWLQDNRLFWAKAALGDATQSPRVELWRLQPGEKTFLTQQQVLQIPTNGNIYPAAATRLADGRLMLALVNADHRHGGQSGLYELDLVNGVLYKRNDFPVLLPADLVENVDYFGPLIWSPDGTGAIYLRPIPRSLYLRAFHIPTNGVPAQEINALLGNRPEQFQWLRVD